MGVKTFSQELKTKVTASRLFKALITEPSDVLPKVTTSIKSIEIVHGDTGSIIQTNFPEGALFKCIKNRIDEVDHEKHKLSYVMMMNISTVNCLRNYTRKMYNEAELGTWSLRSKTSFHVDQAEKTNQQRIEGSSVQSNSE